MFAGIADDISYHLPFLKNAQKSTVEQKETGSKKFRQAATH
jgi:hypothetical protein